MKIIAWTVNVSLLAMTGILVMEQGLPSFDDGEFMLFALVVAAPSISCWVFWTEQQPPKDGEEGTLQLARKALRAKLKKAAQD